MNKSLVFFIFLIGFFIFSANIWGLSIYSLDEAKNATCAKEMIQRGDYIVPTFNYELRTDKPPMHYYFMILAYKLFGFSEFSARFFSSVFGLLTLILTFWFSYKTLGYKTAIFSSVVLISSLHTALQFHMAVPDPYLIFYLNGVFFSFYIWFKERKDIYLYAMYIFMGLGVLTKGPVAVVLPSVIVVLFLIYTHSFDLKTIKDLKPVKGILITTLVAIPWYIAVGLKTDWVWVHEFIFKHNINRFSSPMEGHGGFFAVTLLFVFFGLLPFSVFIIQSFLNVWKNKHKDVLVYMTIIAVTYVGFFSISGTKLPNYTTPAYPALAVILGYFTASLYEKNIKKYRPGWSLVTLGLISLAICAGLFTALRNEKELSDIAYVGFIFILWTVGSVVAFWFLVRKKIDFMVYSISLFSILLIISFFFFAFAKIDKRNPVVVMLPLIERDKPVAYYRGFNPAFAFYLGTPIPKLRTVKDVEKFLSREEKVYIITRKKYLKDLKKIKNLKILSIRKDLFEKTTSVLISNRD